MAPCDSINNSLPHLRETATSAQIIVKGEPLLLLAAELHNSSLSSPEYMRTVWQKLVDANINTVLGSVTWETIEPAEGNFDFSKLDQVIRDARRFNLHLILLWFGSYKNGKSSYVPSWVKKDARRFPRAHLRVAGGKLKMTECLSLFDPECAKADAKAFGRLMAHLKEIDEDHSTVIMVQVENEIGLLGDSRDGSTTADMKFSEAVPEEFVAFLQRNYEILHPSLKENLNVFKIEVKHGASWQDTFGVSKRTDELFMAYHYAKYLNTVAASGKHEYSIPLYTNVWMSHVEEDSPFPAVAAGGGDPGDYPSGGPVPNTVDIFHKFAPNLDFIAPDTYLNDYVETCSSYTFNKRPLFIPEQRRDEFGARRVWVALGTYAAIGTSPFGIDSIDLTSNPFKKHYGLLASVAPIILEAQRNPGTSVGFFFDDLSDKIAVTQKSYVNRFEDYELTIQRAHVFGRPGPGAGMVIYLRNSRFLLIGWGFQVTFRCLKPGTTFTGILRCEEKEVVEPGKLRTLRVLNGDETNGGAWMLMPNEEPDYGGFPIPVSTPAKTMIAEVEPYALQHSPV